MIEVVVCMFAIVVVIFLYKIRGEVTTKRSGRFLGAIEQTVTALGGLTMCRTFVFVSRVPITLEMVQIGFIKLTKRHPMLRVRLINQRDKKVKPCFALREDVIVDIEERQDNDPLSTCEELIKYQFTNQEKPLWFIKYLPQAEPDYTSEKYQHQCTLIFVCHHAIIDGISLMRLIDSLMEHLQSDIEGSTSIETDITKSLDIPPSSDTLADIQVKRPYLDRFLVWLAESYPKVCIAVMNWVSPYTHTEHKTVTEFICREARSIIGEPTTSMVPITLNVGETAALMTNCKQNGVSPLAALIASYFITLDKEMSIRCIPVSFSLSSNFRSRKGVDVNDIIHQAVACYIAYLEYLIVIPIDASSKFWEFAKKCHSVVHKDLEKNTVESLYRKPAFIPMMTNVKPASIINRSSMLGNFNNYGRCSFLDRDDDCPIRLHSSHGCFAGHEIPGSLFSMTCLTFENKLFWNLNCYTNIVTKTMTTKIANDITKLMLDNCQ